MYRSLQSIDKTVNHIHKVLHSERKRDKIRAFVSTGWYTSKLKKCTDDLNWAMELFKASVPPRRVRLDSDERVVGRKPAGDFPANLLRLTTDRGCR